ncbi:hypothetical protein Bbelb_194150 [Branchiostoma belcheri]|nr:hypothetical protein Bbelb_194150 [Branchiostoma belcheri]
MEYDAALEHLGRCGRFQKITAIAMALVGIPAGFNMVAMTFLGAMTDHRCRLHDNSRAGYAGNATEELNASIPWENVGGTWRLSQCNMYVDPLGAEVGENATIAPCEYGWVYDRSQYSSSIVTEVRLLSPEQTASFVRRLFAIYNPEGRDEASRSTRQSTLDNLIIPRPQLEVYRRSLRYSGATVWNSLPPHFDLVCNKAWLTELAQSIYMSGVCVGAVLFGAMADSVFDNRGSMTLALRTEHPSFPNMGIRPRMTREIGGLMSVKRHVSRIASRPHGAQSQHTDGDPPTGWAIPLMFAVAFATDYVTFVTLRFFIGATTNGFLYSGIVIGTEVVHTSRRSLFGMSLSFTVATSYMLLGALAYFFRDWRNLQLAMSIPPLLFVSYWWLAPESPRWLLTNHKTEEAKSVIRRAAKQNGVEIPKKIYELIDEAGDKGSDRHDRGPRTYNMLDLVRTPKLRATTILISTNWFVLSGVYYGLWVGTSTLAGDHYVNFITSACVEGVGVFVAWFTMERCGRKRSSLVFMLIGGCACAATAAVPHTHNMVSTVLAMVGRFGISVSFNVFYVYSAEVFPTVVRYVCYVCRSLLHCQVFPTVVRYVCYVCRSLPHCQVFPTVVRYVCHVCRGLPHCREVRLLCLQKSSPLSGLPHCREVRLPCLQRSSPLSLVTSAMSAEVFPTVVRYVCYVCRGLLHCQVFPTVVRYVCYICRSLPHCQVFPTVVRYVCYVCRSLPNCQVVSTVVRYVCYVCRGLPHCRKRSSPLSLVTSAMSAEVFPTVVRNMGLGVATMLARVGGIIAPFVYLLADTWRPLPLLTFGLVSIFSSLTMLTMPETLGKPLPNTIASVENVSKPPPPILVPDGVVLPDDIDKPLIIFQKLTVL